MSSRLHIDSFRNISSAKLQPDANKCHLWRERQWQLVF